ncbi:MAG: TonB-dependent receptor [Bacteroidota bacterium]
MMKNRLTRMKRVRGIGLRQWFLLPMLLALAEIAFAQTTITGRVTEANEGLPGVSVLIKNTNNGTITDLDGNFRLEAKPSDVLIFSFIGFASQEIAVGTQSVIDVSLEQDVTALDEVVVVGYGTQKKSDLTGAVGTVDGDEISKYVSANATQLLQGRVAGVRTEANGGAPGANAIVTIRGTGTLSDNGPLFVIDGMLTNNMNAINPSDIESVTVLKDASALAIYGSRAANGVVIVKTKKGRAGEVGVDAEISFGFQEVVNTLDYANARQYATIRNQANDNDGTDRSTANDVAFDPSIDSDIQSEWLRTAPIFSSNIRVYGGSENGTYSLSANHLDQSGILRTTSFTRTTVRANSSFTKGKFKLEETIGLTRTINRPQNQFNRERDLLPTIPIRNEFGEFTGSSVPNGATAIYGVGNIGNSIGRATIEEERITRNTVLGNVAGSYEILKGLTYKLNLGIEGFFQNNFKFTPEFFFNATALGRQDFAQLDETNRNFLSTLVENTLNYKKAFGKHNLDLIAGYAEQKTTNRAVGIRGTEFPNNDLRVIQAAGTVVSLTNSREVITGLRSYFGRANYTFDSKYLFTATLRSDGTSLFREGLRWKLFPSMALGWNISNEPFMEGFKPINDLKLRASYGQTGSNNVAAYAIIPTININSEAVFGENQQRVPGSAITSGSDPNLIWETTTTLDIGLEFGLLDGRLQVTMDYFSKESEDILADVDAPFYTGFRNRIVRNATSIRNRGFEFLGSYANSIGDLTFNVTGNFTVLDNEVTALGVPDPIVGGGFTSNGLDGTLTDVGQPVASFYGHKVVGIYQSDQEAIDDGRTDGAGAGDFKFQDTDGDGVLTGDDRVFLGSSIPDFEYGLTISAEYKNFDLSFFFNGIAGNEILNANIYRGYFDTEGNYLADAVKAWTPENPNTNIPRSTLLDPGTNRRMSDFLLESGAYFRLRNFQVGYTLPISNVSFKRIRLYGSVQNLFTITEYSGYYPEVGRGTRDRGGNNQDIFNTGVDESAYPTARTYRFGVQASF